MPINCVNAHQISILDATDQDKRRCQLQRRLPRLMSQLENIECPRVTGSEFSADDLQMLPSLAHLSVQLPEMHNRLCRRDVQLYPYSCLDS
jgi:hypothetical protein